MDYKSYFKTEGYNDVKLIEGFEETIRKYPQIVEIILNSADAIEVAQKLFENRKNIIVDLPPFMDKKTIDKTQFFALAIQHSKDYDLIDKVIKEIALESGCKLYVTYSDCASVKIGNDNFNVSVNNRLGDGETLLIIDDNPSRINGMNDSFFDYQLSIEGKDFYIYEYDCGEKKLVDSTTNKPIILNGHYIAYSNDGYVMLKRL